MAVISFQVTSEADQTRRKEAEDKFYLQYGRTMDAWGMLEHSLADWFRLLTGMPQGLAEEIFFSARTFSSKYELIKAARSHHQTNLNEKSLLLFDTCLTMSKIYSEYRNQLAHRIFVFHERDKEVSLIDGVKLYKEKGLLITHLEQYEICLRTIRSMLYIPFSTKKNKNAEIDKAIAAMKALPKAFAKKAK